METTRTVSAIDVARERCDFELELITVIEEESAKLGARIDDFNLFSIGLWTYDEPETVKDRTPEGRRSCAVAWLSDHARLVQRVARRMGHVGPIEKVRSNDYFGVRVTFRRSVYVGITLVAQVPSELTCEMVPTGEVDHIPARDVPVMERRCPESIFAGVEQEVTV